MNRFHKHKGSVLMHMKALVFDKILDKTSGFI